MKTYLLKITMNADSSCTYTHRSNDPKYIRRLLKNFFFTSDGHRTTNLLDYNYVLLKNDMEITLFDLMKDVRNS